MGKINIKGYDKLDYKLVVENSDAKPIIIITDDFVNLGDDSKTEVLKTLQTFIDKEKVVLQQADVSGRSEQLYLLKNKKGRF